jgi:drug/metabolite transporter (DMT)-like permease
MTSDPASRSSQALKGCALMVCAVGLFPFLNASVKLLSAGYPVPQIVWARFAGHLVFVMIAFLPWRGIRLLVAQRPGLQIGRSFLLLASTAFYMSGIAGVPLATASVILFSTPLIVAALSQPLLGEHVGPRRWIAMLVGFAGVLVVFRPGSTPVGAAGFLIFGSAVAYSLYQIVSRRSGVHDTAETGIVYAALVGTAVASLFVPFVWKTPQTLVDAALFCGLGIFGGFGHYLVTRAFQLAPAAVVSPLGYLELVGMTALGYLIFGNVPDAHTITGAAIIIGSGLYIAGRERGR